MPDNNQSRRIRRTRRPNVFIQEDVPSANGSSSVATAVAVDSDGAAAMASSTGAARRRSARGRNSTARADLYTRSLGKEVRLIALLTVLAVGTIIVLKFVAE